FRRLLFLFQAEDGIRDFHVTGVQTCALPISGDQGVGEHRAAGGFGPVAWVVRVDHLAPEAGVFAFRDLVREQGAHHARVAGVDGGVARVAGGQFAQQFGHAGGDPAVAARPAVAEVGVVHEQAVVLLQHVEVFDHGGGGEVEVGGVAGPAPRLHLQCGNHVHVVDGQAPVGVDAFAL